MSETAVSDSKSRAPGTGQPAASAAEMGVQRPLVMAVVNVTPDSFSDGGRWFDSAAAVEHGLQLIEQGADILDVGGESTRPGAQRPTAEEEARRVVPVVRDLVAAGARVSVDTMRASVAEAAVSAGASIINDVSGALADPAMRDVAAATGATFVAMHWRGHSVDMQQRTTYDDIVADVCRELAESVAALREAGVRDDKLVVDPGFGFANTAEQNWKLLARMGGTARAWGRGSGTGACPRAAL